MYIYIEIIITKHIHTTQIFYPMYTRTHHHRTPIFTSPINIILFFLIFFFPHYAFVFGWSIPGLFRLVFSLNHDQAVFLGEANIGVSVVEP
jgi:hypothetical protein